MPQNSHAKPIQLMLVPVKVSVAVAAPATSDAITVPLLDVTPVCLSPTVDHGPADAIPVSSTRVTVDVPVTVKLLALVAVPPGVVTLIGPVVAPPGTVAVIDVDEFTVKLTVAPVKVTAVAPVKLVPLIVALVPTGPLVGVTIRDRKSTRLNSSH